MIVLKFLWKYRNKIVNFSLKYGHGEGKIIKQQNLLLMLQQKMATFSSSEPNLWSMNIYATEDWWSDTNAFTINLLVQSV